MSEGEKSSTWRELSAIDYALKSFLPIIKGSYLKWFSDSQTAVRIIQVGSMKKELHDLAIKIFQCCAENQINLDIQWIPRSDLERADWTSMIGRSPTHVLSISRNYGGLIPLTALLITITKKSKNFSRDPGT